MKITRKLALGLVALLVAMAMMAAAPLQGSRCGNLVLGGVCTLEEGDTLGDGMVVMGGSATLESGSLVESDVVIMGGSLRSNGAIEGSIVVLGGLIDLGETAVVEGDVVVVGGNVQRDDGARIDGEMIDAVTGFFPFIVPGLVQIPDWNGAQSIVIPGESPRVDVRFNPFWDGLWLLLRSFLWAVLAVLVVLFLPQNTERAAQAAVSQPLASGGLGCATAVVIPILLIALAITICGIPLSLIGLFLLAAAWAFGLIAVSLEVGTRLAGLFKGDWALPVSAGVGAFVVTLLTNGIALVPCIGWFVPVLVGSLGLGAVLLTRFGAQGYPLDVAPFPPPPVPPPPPVAPLAPPEPEAVDAPPPPEPDEPDEPEGIAEDLGIEQAEALESEELPPSEPEEPEGADDPTPPEEGD